MAPEEIKETLTLLLKWNLDLQVEIETLKAYLRAEGHLDSVKLHLHRLQVEGHPRIAPLLKALESEETRLSDILRKYRGPIQ